MKLSNWPGSWKHWKKTQSRNRQAQITQFAGKSLICNLVDLAPPLSIGTRPANHAKVGSLEERRGVVGAVGAADPAQIGWFERFSLQDSSTSVFARGETRLTLRRVSGSSL